MILRTKNCYAVVDLNSAGGIVRGWGVVGVLIWTQNVRQEQNPGTEQPPDFIGESLD